MIVGTGVDAAEVVRIERVLGAAHGARFRDRVFTPEEQRYCEARGRGRAESYTARFAAKEATMKALGVGWGRDAAFHEIEVVRKNDDAPELRLSGTALATARRRGIARFFLSITHASGLAIAFVIAEAE